MHAHAYTTRYLLLLLAHLHAATARWESADAPDDAAHADVIRRVLGELDLCDRACEIDWPALPPGAGAAITAALADYRASPGYVPPLVPGAPHHGINPGPSDSPP